MTKYEEEFKNKESEAIEAEKIRIQKEQEAERLAEQERELAEKRRMELEIEEQEREQARVLAEKMAKEQEFNQRNTAKADEIPQEMHSAPQSVKSDGKSGTKQRAAPAPPSNEAPKAQNASNLKPVAPRPPTTEVPEKSKNITTTKTAPKEMSFNGVLNRKQELDNRGKNSKHRSWNQLFVVLSNNQLMFFKDSQTAGKSMQDGKYNSSSRSTFKGEPPLPIQSCTIEVATDYSKRSNVFRLKLSAGAEYLFQAQTTDEMNMWVQKFKEIQASGNNGLSPTSDNISVTSSQTKSKRGLFGRKK